MTATVSILGCGWLGRPLGAHLAAQGVSVRGSTTTPEKLDALRREGIDPVLLRLDPELSGEPGALFESPILVLNIPPPRGIEDVTDRHRRQVRSVLDAATNGAVEWILFASSTGVYPNVERTVTEADLPPGQPEALPGPRRRTGTALLEVEGLLMNAPEVDATIVRLGGLYGPDRHPGRFLAGRSDVARPHAPVNLIHRDDAVGVFATLLAQDVRGDVFNACADEHPTRQDLYTRAAHHLGLDPPTFDLDDRTSGKLVSNERFKTRCGYTFRHPDPLADLSASTTEE
ncbi:MAG: SDR family oxidoreductase [Salinivenus sp.]